MLKKPITYEDFNGDTVTEDFYFNFTRTEVMNLQVSVEGGMAKRLEDIINAKDPKEMVPMFQDFILMSYGVKSDDGKKFIKNEELKKDFEQSAAYDALIWEITMDEKAAADFINGITPKNLNLEGPQDRKPPLPPSS